MTAHGFRASASTMLNERGFPPDVIEAALAHQDQDAVRRVYNRARYWKERVTLMQAWADLLDDFRKLPPPTRETHPQLGEDRTATGGDKLRRPGRSNRT